MMSAEDYNGSGRPEPSAPPSTDTQEDLSNSSVPMLALQDPTGSYLVVRITDQERSRDDRVAYIIETRAACEVLPQPLLEVMGDRLLQTCRYYSDFHLLRQFLELKLSDCLIPPLPDKLSSLAPWKIAGQKFDQDFLENRRFGLELFINRLLKHRRLGLCQQVVAFLRDDSEWRLRVFTPMLSRQLDQFVLSRSASLRLRHPPPQVATLRSSAATLKSALLAVAKAYERVVRRHHSLHKLHSGLGSIFSDWCGLEAERGSSADALQTVGHYMDVYASSADSALGEDDQLLNRVREYCGFCDSITSLCRQAELRALRVEQLEDQLKTKRDEKLRVETDAFGVSLRGLRAKIFGAQTPEQKRVTLYQLEEDVARLDSDHAAAEESLRAICTSVELEIAEFEQQKAIDLSEILDLLCSLRVEKLRRAYKIWSHCRDTFQQL